MAAASAQTQQISSRYAQALLDTADSEKSVSGLLKDADTVEASLQNEAFSQFIQNPLMSAQEQDGVVQDVAKKQKLSAAFSNLLRLLVENRRLPLLPQIIKSIRAEADRRMGILNVDIESAYPVAAAQEKQILKVLAEATGREVRASVTVNPSLIGGMTVRVGSLVIDDTVAGRLARLKRDLGNFSNENNDNSSKD